jgi:tight adherence protein C
MASVALIPVLGILAVVGLACLLIAVCTERDLRLESRLRELSGKPVPPRGAKTINRMARSALPGMASPLLPGYRLEQKRLQSRLLHAGLYSRQAMVVFLAVKTFLTFAPWLIGLGVGLAGLVPMWMSVAGGAVVGLAGLAGPGVWLDRRMARRQGKLRRGLPDVLDVLVLCLESGSSLYAAFGRVTAELRDVHPELATELNIVQREVRLGQSLSDALRRFGDRCNMEEVVGLATIIDQTERFGAGLVKTLRGQAEHLRFRRQQRAEEQAQKAGAKVLIPTLLLIFPGIFLVVLGPAAFQVQEIMAKRTVNPAPPKAAAPASLAPQQK